MTKKCKQIQRLLDRYQRAELSQVARESVETHVAACADCARELAFHQALDSRLAGFIEAPEGLLERVDSVLSEPAQRRSWLTQAFGDPTMKKILFSSTAVAAALVGVLMLVPGQAQGATAKEKFVSMRSALAKAAKDGELTVSATVTNNGLASINASLDGVPLPPDVPVIVNSKEDGDFIDYMVTIDLSDANYSSISFGKDSNTLNLIPKAKPSNLDVVRLDPKTGKPLAWSTFASKQGVMEQLSTLNFNSLKTRLSESSSIEKLATNNQIASLITLHLRVGKGNGTSTITVQKDH